MPLGELAVTPTPTKTPKIAKVATLAEPTSVVLQPASTNTPTPAATLTPVPPPTATPLPATATAPPAVAQDEAAALAAAPQNAEAVPPTARPEPPAAIPTEPPPPPTATPSPAPASGGSKKGVGVTAPPGCQDLESLSAGWYFNWQIDPDPTCGGLDARFVPRIYNAASMARLADAVANAQPSGWLIGFSEPNLPHQGDLSPAQAATYWKQIEDAAGGIKLVSPSPNQWEPGQHEPYGHQWLWAMVDEYQKQFGARPRFDAIGWNIYAGNHQKAVEYLAARHNEALARGYDVPIWVLEYAGRCWANDGNEQIMAETTAWFNATPWIGRYAWYANRLAAAEASTGTDYTSCTLINPASGEITALGNSYKNH